MRKLTAFLFMSLDGVVEAPDQFVRPELYADFPPLIAATIAEQDTVLLGRRTYGEWAAFWPNSDIQPFAGFINTTPKIIVSETRPAVDWPGSTLLPGALEAGIAQLKRTAGGTIGVHGSISLVRALLTAGLLDELRLIVCPVIAGHGRRLLGDTDASVQLDLISAQSTPTGLQYLVYHRR
ncbi:MAG: dihydrofolate reductase family protein [Polymorphobacter sp.]